MKCVKMFLRVDDFWSVKLECEKNYLIVQNNSKFKIQKDSK